MKRATRIARALGAACLTAAMAAGTAAHAQSLTVRQCTAYPFAKPRTTLTHRQVIGELAELEAVGFSPAEVNGSDFPDAVRAARLRLAREYRRDCMARRRGVLHAAADRADPADATEADATEAGVQLR